MNRNSNHKRQQSRRDQESEDEALARALQMQFEREEATTQPDVAQPTPPRNHNRSNHSRNSTSAAAAPNAVMISDEEIARRVQAQEEERYRQRMAAQQQQPNNTVAATATALPSLGNYSSANPRTPERTTSGSSKRTKSSNSPLAAAGAVAALNTERSDAELARRLAAEEEAAQAAAAVAAANSRGSSHHTTNSGGFVFPAPDNREASNSNKNKNSNNPATTQSASGGYVFPGSAVPTEVESSEDELLGSGSGEQLVFAAGATTAASAATTTNNETNPDEDADAKYARRVEQELQDELVAERLQQREQYKANRAAAVAEQNEIVEQNQTRTRRRKLLGTLITLGLVIGAVIGLIYYFVIMGGGVPGVTDLTPEDFANEDPFNELDPNDANSWKNSGQGVSLQVINALETAWYQYFYDAVDDWDSGYPDCLTLGTEFNGEAGKTSHDAACSTVNGKIKVCNGNYGNTRWKGINEVLIDGAGNIIASAARMNEFYLGDHDDDHMQYTMCHEIGHAFGLGHTDETFGNANLGDCMDYTNEPQENRKPTIRNFSFLYELYGLVPGAAPYSPPTPAPVTAPTAAPSVSPAVVVSQNSPASNSGNGQRERTLRHQNNHPPTLRRNTPEGQSIIPHDTARTVTRTVSAMPNNHEPLPDWLTQAVEDVLDRHQGQRLKPHVWRELHSHRLGAAHQTDLPQGYTLRVHYLWANDGEDGT